MHASTTCVLIINIYNTYGCSIYTDKRNNKLKHLILNSPSGTTDWEVTDIAVYHTHFQWAKCAPWNSTPQLCSVLFHWQTWRKMPPKSIKTQHLW